MALHTINLMSAAKLFSDKSMATGTGYFTMAGGKMGFVTAGHTLGKGASVVGTVTKTANGYSYTAASGAGAQSISGIGTVNPWTTVRATSFADVISFAKDAAQAATVYGGSGADSIYAGNAFTGSAIYGEQGNDLITFATGKGTGVSVYGGEGNDTIGGGVTGAYIDGGAGNDSIISGGSNTIILGAGTDYVRVGEKDTVTAGTGNNTIDMTGLTAGTAYLARYAYGSDVISVGSNYANMFDTYDHAQKSFLASGGVTNGTATLAYTSELTAYSVTISNGKKTQDVFFSGSGAGQLNASGSTKNLVMVSNNNTEGNYILGGSGRDTIFAGAGDSVNGGAGNDDIYLNTADDRTYVGIGATSGKDVVTGFVAGTEDTSDVVYLFNGFNNSTKVSVDGTSSDVKISGGTSSLTLKNAATSGAATFLATDASGAIRTVSSATKGATITAPSLGDYYVGTSAAVDFSQVGEDVQVDLGNSNRYTTGSPTFVGVVAATGASNGTNKLVGAAGTKNTLQGGAGGENSIYGGGSAADLLVGAGSAADVFFYGKGDGNDTINSLGSEDVVAVYTPGAVTGGSRTSDGTVKVNLSDGKKLSLTNITDANTIINYSLNGGSTVEGLKVGQTDTQNTFTYDETVSIYWGGKQGDTLQIATTDDAKIWLDGSRGKMYSGINTLDGSAASGNVELAGSGKSDSIVGGVGEASMWGGAGAVNDTMTGGSGYNEFYFGKGNGKDVITNSNNDDKVMLYDVAFADVNVAATKVNGSDMVITLNDGSTLTINNYASNGASTFQLTDGTWNYNKDTSSWTQV